MSARRTSVKGHPGVYWRTRLVAVVDADGNPKLDEHGNVKRHEVRSYEISYYDSDGNRRWKTLGVCKLDDADRALRDLRVRMDKGERIAPTKKTLNEVAEEWLASQTELRPSTRERYRNSLDVHILPRLGRLRVGEITTGHVAQLLADMRTGAYYAQVPGGRPVREKHKRPPAGATLVATLRPLSRILEDCDEIAGNPVRQLKKGQRPKIRKRRPRVFAGDELERLFHHASELYRPLLATAAYTGLRQSELLGLRWRDVAFDDGVIHVNAQLDRQGHRVEPKTEQAVRDVALAPRLGQLLREHRLASPRSGDGDYVFVNEAGEPFNHRNVQARGFDKAAAAAALDEGQPRKSTFHDLRRTFGSMLIEAGSPIAHVSKQMGHANPAITLSIYTAEIEARANVEQTRATLDAAIGPGTTWNRPGAAGGDKTGAGRGEIVALVRDQRPLAAGGD